MSERSSQGHDEEELAPPDLSAVLADDRLVESVASGELTGATVSGEVLAMLVAWRDDIDAKPLPLHPDLDEAQVALLAGARASRWRVPLRVLSPVAAAAAAVGIALVGIGYGAHQSTPGDPLWGVSQAIFAGHSRSVQAAANVTAELATAETAIASGAPEQARTALDRAAANLPAVGAGEDRQGLELRRTELVARLSQATTGTDPGAATAASASTGTTSNATSTSSSTPTSTDTTTAPSTGSSASTTRTGAPTKTPGPTTSAAPTTTSAAPATTSATPTTTSAAPITTSAAPITTSAAPTSASAAPAPTSTVPGSNPSAGAPSAPSGS